MTLEQCEARCLELGNVLERVLEQFEPERDTFITEVQSDELDEEGMPYIESRVVCVELQEALELAEDVLYRGLAYAEE